MINQERPNNITKLAFYLQEKEPIIFLFIINSEFIPDEEGEYLGPFMAGVRYKNKRIQFFYKSNYINSLSPENLYFLILHEAYHIFKNHLLRHKTLENKFLANYASDAVINYEIKKLDLSYDLIPEIIEGSVIIPEDFINYFNKLNEEAIETNRLYYWLLERSKKLKKSNFLKYNFKVKIKSTNKYGKIVGVNEEDKYKVKSNDKTQWYDENELIPVIKKNKKINELPINIEFEHEFIQNKHFELNKNDKIDQTIFVEKIIKQAIKIRNSTSGLSENKGSFLDHIEKLLKPKINWKKELRRRINFYQSDTFFAKNRRKNIINYPWNPVSKYGILCNYWINVAQKLQTYIIFAIDTSGSIFYDKYEIQTFFSEIDRLAKDFSFNKNGQILTIQWDTKITEGISLYKPMDWKKFELKGGGGTTPEIVFKYIESIFNKKQKGYEINENNVNFIIPNDKKLPLLIFLTDGYFFNQLKEEDLLLYKNNKKNLIYFTKNDNYIYPQENSILYR